MKRSTVCAAVAAVIATLPSLVRAADITYAVSSSFSGAPTGVSLSGTIVTDGAIGYLQDPDILSYDVTATFNSETVEETTSNSDLSQFGLEATAQSLILDLNNFQGYYLGLFSALTDNSSLICWEDNSSICTLTGAGVALQNPVGIVYPYSLTSDTIATAVSSAPEPAAWAMMLIGSASVGAVARRRRGPGFAA